MTWILTFHSAVNYGAVLQCYALYSTINSIEKCEVIDYDGRVKSDEKGIKARMKSAVKSVLLYKSTHIKRKKFEDFVKKNIPLTQKFASYQELCDHHWDRGDRFCVGSDQVWNWDITGGDRAYTLSFAPDGRNNKFSYAASVGRRLDQNHIDELKDLIKDFYGISLRETSACSALKENGIDCMQNIDPVFLLPKERWEQVSTEVKNENDPFVLIYLLQKAPNLLQAAVRYAKKHNLRIVYIATGARRDIDCEYVTDCGPDEFLRYFLKAEAVFTNSFHGISFAILFNKDFFYEYLQGSDMPNSRNSRLKDIIEMFHLEGNNIANERYEESRFDSEAVNSMILRKREEALCYLRAQITGEGKG